MIQATQPLFNTVYQPTRVSTPLKTEIVTQPAAEPVSYAELSDFLRLPTDCDRSLVLALAKAGRIYVEKRTRCTLITTTYNLWLDDFPFEIILPARPAQSVAFVKYIDVNGNQQTVDSGMYTADMKGPRPQIVPKLGTVFPIVQLQRPNAVQVQFVAGFGDTAVDVPETFKLCIKQWVALNYDQREAVAMGKTPAEVPHTFGHLLALCSLPEL